MRCIIFIFCFLTAISNALYAQTDIRAWYADGQVFIIWKTAMPIQESFAIHAKSTPFTLTDDATLIGRPFAFEYLGYGLKENLADNMATYTIPDGQGGLYQLAINEGLFVFTPHQNGALYFSVTKWGEKQVVSGQNITSGPVPFRYDPINESVQCHLQRTFPSPFTGGYTCFAFVVWADGRQNHLDSREDFPIMANAAKNGMPGLFLVSVPNDLDTTQTFPISVWLHGGGGNARQSLAGSRKDVDINPKSGILVAHDDKMYGYRGTISPHPDQPTWHYGWAKNYDPFTPDIILQNDSIINYTQRRYLWVDAWLIKHFNADENRIHIHGHSMGSAGTLGLVKAFPGHYASASIFNTGCAGPIDSSNNLFIFGKKEDNFPTNLTNREGKAVRFYDLWDMFTNCSPERDLPLIRHWHGKNDDNGTMKWSAEVVRNYIICDSLGTGAQNFWSERPHGIDLSAAYNDHWIMGNASSLQTEVDNVDFAEARFRSDESYPAFFNHRLDKNNRDPGSGMIGVNNGDGDNWGTWGGYHRWDHPVENAQNWMVNVWLEGSAVFQNDRSPADSLIADLAIHRPAAFFPATGTQLSWKTEDISTGTILQSGNIVTKDEGLVVIPAVKVFREDIRKIKIHVQVGTSSSDDEIIFKEHLRIQPNPAHDYIILNKSWESLYIRDITGKCVYQLSANGYEDVIPVSSLHAGWYRIEIVTRDKQKHYGSFIKI